MLYLLDVEFSKLATLLSRQACRRIATAPSARNVEKSHLPLMLNPRVHPDIFASAFLLVPTTTGIVLAHVGLGRIGARFALAYPEVQPEIVAEDRVVNLVEEANDLIIRSNSSPDERLAGHNFLNDERLIVDAGRAAALSNHRGRRCDHQVCIARHKAGTRCLADALRRG